MTVWEGVNVYVRAGALSTNDAEVAAVVDAMALVARRKYGVFKGEGRFVFIDRRDPNEVIVRMTFEGPMIPEEA